MLWGDAREDWDGATIADPRVIHFWDGERIIGQWFAKEIDGYEGVAWDIYYLYGPEAVWDSVASPLVGAGGTIIHEHEKLAMEISALIEK